MTARPDCKRCHGRGWHYQHAGDGGEMGFTTQVQCMCVSERSMPTDREKLTARPELPAWVVERCDREKLRAFIWEGARHEQLTAAALAAFLAIIEERGLRIVPTRPTNNMIREAGHGNAHLPEPWAECAWLDMVKAAPPLAALLEDRE